MIDPQKLELGAISWGILVIIFLLLILTERITFKKK